MENEDIPQKEIKERLREEKKKGSRLIAVSGDERDGDYFLIYHLDQEESGNLLNLEVKLSEKEAERITGIFENADLYERECKEMYGLDFGEEMRNLFLPEGVEEPSTAKLKEAMEKEEKEKERGRENA